MHDTEPTCKAQARRISELTCKAQCWPGVRRRRWGRVRWVVLGWHAIARRDIGAGYSDAYDWVGLAGAAVHARFSAMLVPMCELEVRYSASMLSAALGWHARHGPRCELTCSCMRSLLAELFMA